LLNSYDARIRFRYAMARKPPKSVSRSTVLLRIELLNMEPLIWRRVRVPAKWTLRRLHGVLQKVFGWEDRHLHEFQLGDLRIGMPELDESEAGLQDDREWTLAEVLRTGAQEFLYVYDFGDEWEHRLIVEPAARTEAGAQLAPMCLAGENAAPPEDVGGPPGYELFLEALGNPQHEQHEEMLEWIGGIWDPRAFDINRVNRSLRSR
jgi:hypothetical protein